MSRSVEGSRMGSLTVTLEAGHGYCILLAIATAFYLSYEALTVGRARRKYKIYYPTMYAPPGHKNEKEFNCIQRAHQNCLEYFPPFLLALSVGCLKRPYIAAVLGKEILHCFELLITYKR